MSTNLPGSPESQRPTEPVAWPGSPPVFVDEEEGSAGGASILRYLSALARHRWLILGVTALGTVGGVIASRFIKPEYTTQATLWLEVSSQNSGDVGPIRTGQLLESTAWIELLRSYTVLDFVVQQERLYIETESERDEAAFTTFGLAERFRPGEYRLTVDTAGNFVLSTDAGMEVQRGRVGEPIGSELGFTWTPPPNTLRPGSDIRFEIQNPRDVAVALGQDLGTRMESEGNFLRLTLSGDDAEEITRTLNTVTDRYVEVAADLKRSRLDELTEILEEQRRYAEDNVKQAELALESFRVNTITLPSDRSTPVAPGLEITRDPVFSGFFDMRVEREQLKQDAEAISRIVGQLRTGEVSVEALALVPTVVESSSLTQALNERTEKRAELRALLQRYTPEHENVRLASAQVESLERETIPRLALGLVSELRQRQAELDQRIAASSEDLQQIPPRTIEEARLQRQVDIANTLHTTLKQRYEEARLAAASSIPDIRVLDEAVVPFDPTSDNRTMTMIMGFLGSLGLAIAGVVAFDRFDPRVRYPEQVTHEMGLPILSAVPHVKKLAAQRDENSAQVAESLRELRLSLMHAHGAAGPLVLTITSPESGEGKSFIASNLAASFAEQGHRTLLIDGDIRRGALHRLFGVSRKPGLTDYLAGQASYEQVVQATEVSSVYLVGAGTRMANGPELLGSRAMTELVTRLRPHFGVILIDSPPLGAGIDPYVLGTVTRDLLLVLRTGSSNRTFAEAKLELMSRLPIRVLGAVLNGTPDSQVYRYYSYLPGYRAEEEEMLQLQAE